MSKKKIVGISIPVLLFAVVLAFGIWQWQTARAATLDLNGTREKAYYSAMDGLTNLETDLGKVLIAQSPGQHALLLGRIASLANSVSENLASLPSAYGADEDGMKFLSQTADYAQSLATISAEGQALSDQDEKQLAQLQQKCGELRTHLENGAGFVYDTNVEAEKTSGIDYPTLLYDGPFSDGARLGKAKGLSGADITAEEAVRIATAFLGAEAVTQTQRSTDTAGPVPTYGVSLELNDVRVTANVTKQGGKILWMAPDTAGFTPELDIEECAQHAKAFLTSRGFGEMESSYYQLYDGLAVISFAAVQDSVVLYPDLVKVQVRMDSGAVVGIEANNYWMNHVQRDRLHPKLSEEEARAYVSAKLTIEGAKLCVIPVNDGLGTGRTEVLCWEFDGTAADSRYLLYIDAETGREEEVLKVVLGGDGVLTL